MRLAFNTVSKYRYGYDKKAVDSFLKKARKSLEEGTNKVLPAHLETVTFDMVKGGYNPIQVDSTINRIEKNLIYKMKSEMIEKGGYFVWVEHIKRQVEDIKDILVAEDGKRFSLGENSEPAYNIKQVDLAVSKIFDQVKYYLQKDLGIERFFTDSLYKRDEIVKRAILRPKKLKKIFFKTEKGKKGYNCQEVDDFLAKVFLLFSEF